MAEVDTSSYLKPAALPAQKSVLDQVGQYQQLESNKIGIDQQKLKLVNDQFNLMVTELQGLLDTPNATKQDAAVRLQNFAKTYNMPANVVQQQIAELNAAPDVKTFATQNLVRGMNMVERLNKIYGAPTTIDNGQQVQPALQRTGEAPRPVGLPVQRQLPPATETVGPDGKPRLLGPQAPQMPAGATEAGNGAAPGQISRLPVARPNAPQEAAGPNTGVGPLYEGGLKQFQEDQNIATSKMTAMKPALQALQLMKNLRSGPGTEQWTKAVAFLKANGIIDIQNENDPTVVYQEVSKKLAQYVQNNPVGQRSDAAQALGEAASPNPKTQINPALMKLTRDAIILDRVEASRANAFEGQDYSKYGQHRSTYPQRIDERAFGLDLMEPKDRVKLVNDMGAKLKSKDKEEVAAAKRFFDSLREAKKQNFYSGGLGE